MKPRNFPARKLARQMAAEARLEGQPARARDYVDLCGSDPWGSAITQARAIRTKKKHS